jgi:hypothetical protein
MKKGTSSVYNITRGGLVPAAIIAREPDVRLVDTVCVASYADQDRGDISEIQFVHPIAGQNAQKK